MSDDAKTYTSPQLLSPDNHSLILVDQQYLVLDHDAVTRGNTGGRGDDATGQGREAFRRPYTSDHSAFRDAEARPAGAGCLR